MQKKKSIMSLSIDEGLQDVLTKAAKENNISRSELIRNLVNKFIVGSKKTTVVEHDEHHLPVVLKIPISLKGNAHGLQEWLDLRVAALVSKLG